MTSKNARRLTAALALVLAGTACERELTDLEPAKFPGIAEVFIDGFGPGVDFAAFGTGKLDALSVDESEAYSGTASLRFEIPAVGDPSGGRDGFAGGAFYSTSPRDLSDYNVLTFWAKSSRRAVLDLVGFGDDIQGNDEYSTLIGGLELFTSWQQFAIPIPDPGVLTAEGGLLLIADGSDDGDAYTIWIDEVKFENLSSVGTPQAELLTRTVGMAVGETIEASVSVTVPVAGESVAVGASPAYFTFTSSDPSVATVSEAGLITKVAEGTAVITATLRDVAVSGSVTVQDGGLAGLVFDEGFGSGVFFDTFGDNADPNALSIDDTEAYQGNLSVRVDVPAVGDPAGFFAGGVLKTDDVRDLSGFTALTFWAKAATPAALDLAGLGNDNTGTSQYRATRTLLPLGTDWQRYVVPIPDPAKLDAEGGLFTFAEGSEGGPANTIWFDDIVYVDLDELGTVEPALVSETVNLSVGDTARVNYSVSFPVGAETVSLAFADARYFTWTSSDESVATVDEFGLVTMVAEGSAEITATLGGVAATGALTVQTAGATPTEAAPTPTQAPGDVISLFSDAYTDVPVDRFASGFQGATTVFTEVTVAGDATLRYSSLNYEVAEFTGANSIDASGMTHFRMDIWTPNATEFAVKLADFGADNAFDGGDDSESVRVIFNPTSTPALAQGEWVTLDIPLSEFTGLASLANLSQLVIDAAPASDATVYVDNIFFYNDGGGGGGGGGPFDGGEVLNGSFETGDLTNWVDPAPGAGTVTVVNTDSNSGTFSARAQVGPAENVVLQQNGLGSGSVADGDEVSISFFVKGTLADGAVVQTVLAWEAASTGVIGTPVVASVGDWTEYTYTTTVTGGNLANGFSLQLLTVCGGAGTCTGDVLIDDVSVTITAGGGGGGGGGGTEPTVAAPTPTRDAGSVISLFSGAYTDVTVDTWNTVWSSATYEEVQVAGDDAKKYSSLDFNGIETTSTPVDASGMTHIHLDIWTPDATQFGIKLVDAGPNGTVDGAGTDDSEFQLDFNAGTTPALATGQWVSLDIPLSDFTGLTGTANLAQYIIVGQPAGASTVWVDNVYFYDAGGSGGGGGGGGAQIALPITFDDGAVDYTVTDFPDDGTVVTTLVADPTDAGNTVASTVKGVGAPLWGGTTMSTAAGLATAIPFTASNTVMTVRVYSPDAGIPVRLKVETVGDPTRSVETEAVTTVANAWETLTFDFSNEATGTAALNLTYTYNLASIFFNFGTDGTTAGQKTYLWDDVAFQN